MSKRKYDFTIGTEITIVGHGYQLDILDASQATSDGNGIIRRSICRDFCGNHDESEMANFIAAKFVQMMATIERDFVEHKKELSKARRSRKKV